MNKTLTAPFKPEEPAQGLKHEETPHFAAFLHDRVSYLKNDGFDCVFTICSYLQFGIFDIICSENIFQLNVLNIPKGL